MRIRTLVFVSLSTLASLGLARPSFAEPTPPHRVVGQSLSATQAVLLDEDAGEYRVVRVGDELNGSRVIAIGAEDVLLVRGGTQEVLKLGADPRPRPRVVMEPLVINIKPMTLAPSLTAAPVVVAAPPPGSAPSLVAAPAPVLVPSITPISRADLARGLGDFQALDASVAIEVAPQGGFRVAQLRAGSFLNRMGLQRGDVILSVDGRALRTAEDASAAYNWVRVADHFVVELVRDGQPLTLRFRVTP